MKDKLFYIFICFLFLTSCSHINRTAKSIDVAKEAKEANETIQTNLETTETTNNLEKVNIQNNLESMTLPKDFENMNIQNNLENMNIENINEKIILKIDGTEVNVEWEDNESVKAIKELIKNGELTINTHQYGGFEQVGEIGHNIVSDNVQMTTKPGDIVLYAGSNIVLFYGSNSWSYTKLGKIVDKTDEELKSLLNKPGTLLTINIQ